MSWTATSLKLGQSRTENDTSQKTTQLDNIHVTATVTLCELLVKISPVLTKKNIGEIEVCLHSFFTSALTEGFVVNCTHRPLHP